jgi:Bacterial Ig domain/Calx-beta domain
MKTPRFSRKAGRLFLLSFAILTCGAKVHAQTTDSNLIPVVTVEATQPIATAASPGVFTLFRAGNTNATLNVWFDLSGTASNGLDYAAISNHLVEIPAGVTSNTVAITPLASTSSSVAKTVVLTLTNSPLMTPVNYAIGSPSSAVVYIETNGATNLPPEVSIIQPTNGAVFYTPTNILILAKASDPDGFVTNVEFFAGGGAIDIGSGTPVVLDPPGVNGVTGLVYLFNWRNPPSAGTFPLTAVATDNGGLSTTSAPVNISVLQGPRVVDIYRPTNGATFISPVDIPIYATASASNGIASVEFFVDDQDLGPGVLDGCVANPPTVPICIYSLVWSNASVGNHVLTAILTDNSGASTTSLPLNISVLQGPPTNLPPVVRIISPANGTVFHAPVNIPLFSFAADPDGYVTSVEFFAGTNNLGLGQRLPVVTPLAGGGVVVGGPVPPIYPTNLFFLIWTNAPVGVYALTAVATDNGGASTTSAPPVKVTILPSVLPPTNQPPMVSIVASDPVAIEGTNCWVWPGETNWPATWAAWPTAVCRSFTNCGPKTATFTVRRFGDTNYDLTVPYDIGGTASNGVDYVALPGSVTIPAGERRALITIVPIDDGPPDVNKTVILTLLPDMQMNPLPGYVLGYPSRAAAIIIDQGPCPTTGMLPGSCFHLAIPGPDAAWFSVECSTDLVNWTSICTNQVINGSIDFVDPDAASNSSRFYRAVPLTNAPAE